MIKWRPNKALLVPTRVDILRNKYADLFSIGANSWSIEKCIYSASDENGGRAVYEMTANAYGRTSEKSILKVIGIYTYKNSSDINSEILNNHYKRAEREAKLMRLLKGKPHIVQIMDYAITDWELGGWKGKDLLVQMEYLPDTVDHIVEDLKTGTPYNEKLVFDVGVNLCEALEECTESLKMENGQSILHRDIKPANIFCGNNCYKLGDFGISRFLSISELAQTRYLTQAYAAPERISGLTYDKRADIYSVGLVLFVLCNDGYLPYEELAQSKEGIDIVSKRCLEGILPPKHGTPGLKSIILAACQNRPEHRFQKFSDIKKALISASCGQPVNIPILSGRQFDCRESNRKTKIQIEAFGETKRMIKDTISLK